MERVDAVRLICSFPSKIFGLCRNPASARERLLILSTSGVFAVLLGTFLYLRLHRALSEAIGLALLGAVLLVPLIARVILTRKQYQPVTMEICADDQRFSITIPVVDMGGFKCRRQSTALLSLLSAFEYSPSLHCIRICAKYDTYLYPVSSKEARRKLNIEAYYLHLEEKDETAVLKALENLFGRCAVNADQK